MKMNEHEQKNWIKILPTTVSISYVIERLLSHDAPYDVYHTSHLLTFCQGRRR